MGIVVNFPARDYIECLPKYDEPAAVIILPVIYKERANNTAPPQRKGKPPWKS